MAPLCVLAHGAHRRAERLGLRRLGRRAEDAVELGHQRGGGLVGGKVSIAEAYANGEELFTRLGFVKGDPAGPLGRTVHGEYGRMVTSQTLTVRPAPPELLTHNMLMSEVFSQLMFPASAPDVKKRLESLIERDYLEREKDDRRTYRYLA